MIASSLEQKRGRGEATIEKRDAFQNACIAIMNLFGCFFFTLTYPYSKKNKKITIIYFASQAETCSQT
jgi:hypothetical protein